MVIFADRKKALEQRNKNARIKKILPFVTQYHPALPSLKNILMGRWHLQYRTNHICETSLRKLPSFHIAKENPQKTLK